MSATTRTDLGTTECESKWPEDPYKGLAYYVREDIPLFAGRNTDVTRVAGILGDGKIRILLLHGSTGCGKSSFLRAGLIPFLENQIGHFNFAKEAGPSGNVLFIRSTFNPLVELASAAFEAATALEAQTKDRAVGREESARAASESSIPTGGAKSEISHLSEDSQDHALGPIIDRQKYATVTDFTSAVFDVPERLVEVIGRIVYRRPRTQALVIDQAEEVLTLKPVGPEGDACRRQFFKFLAYLSRSSTNFRLIVAFRTEYHGRFYAALRANRIDAARLEDYYLSDLTRRDMEEAINLPCSEEEIPGYGAPRAKYRFRYEDGLPERIAEDLEKTPLTSGTLPVLQIVCWRLYQKAKTTSPIRGLWVIRSKDYEELGGIQGQIDLHLQQALERCCEGSLRFLETKFEIMRWRDVLSELAKPQPDGSIATDIKKAKVLSETAKLQGCKMPFETVMDFLKKDEWKIVRLVEVIAVDTGEKVQCYSLGHDVLGGVLERWRVSRSKDSAVVRKSLIVYGIALAISPLVFNSTLAKAGEAALVIKILILSLSGALLLMAAIPNRKGFRTVYRYVYGWLSNIMGIQRLGGINSPESDFTRRLTKRRS